MTSGKFEGEESEMAAVAEYYDSHDTSTEMEQGEWVEPQRTSGGVELTDDVVDAAAAEAERGYDVGSVRPRRKFSELAGPIYADPIRSARLARIRAELAATEQPAEEATARRPPVHPPSEE